jgi:hypothetical protein
VKGLARRSVDCLAPLVACAWLVGAVSALAADAKVDVVVEQVHASNNGTSVDPALTPMKASFSQAGLNYTSFHRLSREPTALEKGKAKEVALANGRSAKLTLTSVQSGEAHVAVSLPPVETTYKLGREGSVYIQAGPHNGGVLILVLSPVQH